MIFPKKNKDLFTFITSDQFNRGRGSNIYKKIRARTEVRCILVPSLARTYNLHKRVGMLCYVVDGTKMHLLHPLNIIAAISMNMSFKFVIHSFYFISNGIWGTHSNAIPLLIHYRDAPRVKNPVKFGKVVL